jgi:hypothetical protein
MRRDPARVSAALAAAIVAAASAACSDGSGTSGGDDTGGDTGGDTIQPTGAVRVNEVVNKAPDNQADWVELYNTADAETALAGWFIRDQNDQHRFDFPAGTKIPAKGFLVVYGKGGPTDLVMEFAFKSGDAVRLFDPDGKLVDEADWAEGTAPEGTSWGRYPDGTGAFAKLVPTNGMPNVAP